jgi:hypothetical protein
VRNTNKIPDNTSRSGNRRGVRGNSGSTSSHNSSDTTQGALAAIDTPPSLTTDADGIRHPGTGPFIPQSALKAKTDFGGSWTSPSATKTEPGVTAATCSTP